MKKRRKKQKTKSSNKQTNKQKKTLVLDGIWASYFQTQVTLVSRIKHLRSLTQCSIHNHSHWPWLLASSPCSDVMMISAGAVFLIKHVQSFRGRLSESARFQCPRRRPSAASRGQGLIDSGELSDVLDPAVLFALLIFLQVASLCETGWLAHLPFFFFFFNFRKVLLYV